MTPPRAITHVSNSEFRDAKRDSQIESDADSQEERVTTIESAHGGVCIDHTTAHVCTYATRSEPQRSTVHCLVPQCVARGCWAQRCGAHRAGPRRQGHRACRQTSQAPTSERGADEEVPASTARTSSAPERVAPERWCRRARCRRGPPGRAPANNACTRQQSGCGRITRRRLSLYSHRACRYCMRARTSAVASWLATSCRERGSGRSFLRAGTALVRRCGSRRGARRG